MAEAATRRSGGQRLSSRLQRRRPASIQINPVTDWKAAIPLLSPLITSPTSQDLTADIKSCNNQLHRNQASDPEKPIVFKKWHHPAAPFCYEPAPLVAFVCAGAVDRT
ncbi:uncharacterized protein At4g14450, chloroplastic-like [Actinidia eriantha]|uniref:uncharacterized protein At4g14450, chloroplastic-like n=1 Tax=Actinidia eriantha TaxID=165200 RepID=UPI00258E6091|nr:uncharacterized protein At4g14450, chloroplastic-like [Actinidia eriantha]